VDGKSNKSKKSNKSASRKNTPHKKKVQAKSGGRASVQSSFMTAPIPTLLVHAPVKRTASKSLHKRNESKESAIKKSMIETLKKEIDILKLEVK
jgi:hypothetical protein